MGLSPELSWKPVEPAPAHHALANADFPAATADLPHDYPETSLPEFDVPPVVSLSDADLMKLADLITLSQPHAPADAMSAATPWDDAALPSPPQSKSWQPNASSKNQFSPTQAELTTSVSPNPLEKDILADIQHAITRHHRIEIAQGLIKLATHRFEKGLLENAEHCLLKALAFAKAEQDMTLQGQLHSMLGHYYQSHYQHNQALSHLHALIRLADDHPDVLSPEQRLTAYQDMAEIYFYRQDLDQALSLSQQCLALLPNQHTRTAEILFQMALHLDEAGRFAEAIPYYQQSFDISASLQEHDACANILYNLASLYCDQGLLTEAEAALQRSLTYESRQSTPMEQFDAMMLLSEIEEARQNLPQAQDAAKKAYTLAQSGLDTTHIAAACLRLGHLAECLADWQGAKALYQEAESIAGAALSSESRTLIHQKRTLAEEHLAS